MSSWRDDFGQNTLRNRRLATVAYFLSDIYDSDLSYDTEGNVLVDDSYYEDAHILLNLLDGVE